MNSNGKEIERLLDIMDQLLSPQGCPWDREQSHESLARYLIEESYEVIEAIKQQSMEELRDELGDVLLQVVFHAALAKRSGHFDFAQVVKRVADKMIQRHPHVFSTMQLESSEEVMNHWESFKRKEGKKTVLSGIPSMLPALMRAEKIQEKAARVGFDWPSPEGAMDKLKEEIEEFNKASSHQQRQEEMGDILFAAVNLSRLYHIDPEAVLQDSNQKFIRRFNYIEEQLAKKGAKPEQCSLEAMDRLWEEAKVWVEIIYNGEEVLTDLRERIEEAVQGTSIDVLRIKNNRILEGEMFGINEEEMLGELDVEEVFSRCLDANKVPEDQRPGLWQSYREVIASLQEEDLLAE
jgi:tetrapyrrole methylase family protein/MazG family protein